MKSNVQVEVAGATLKHGVVFVCLVWVAADGLQGWHWHTLLEVQQVLEEEVTDVGVASFDSSPELSEGIQDEASVCLHLIIYDTIHYHINCWPYQMSPHDRQR